MTTEDTTLAFCSQCNAVVPAKLAYRNIPTSDQVVTVSNVLVTVWQVWDSC